MISWGNFELFFSTGIPSWTLYTSLAVSGFLILCGLILKCVKEKKRFVFWVLLSEYLFVLVCSTIICRRVESLEIERLQIIPFWTYYSVLNHTPGVSVWDIILNVVLFLPLGILVKLIYPSISALKMLCISIIVSLSIETSQFFFERGIAQIDDVIHNVIGALIGWCGAKGLMKVCNFSL